MIRLCCVRFQTRRARRIVVQIAAADKCAFAGLVDQLWPGEVSQVKLRVLLPRNSFSVALNL